MLSNRDLRDWRVALQTIVMMVIGALAGFFWERFFERHFR